MRPQALIVYPGGTREKQVFAARTPHEPHPINTAEAVIESFFDETLSTQPRLTLTQRGTRGRLVVRAKLELI